MTETQPTIIKVYGAAWCGDTRRARAWLEINAIPYEFTDIDGNREAEAMVKKCSNGYRTIPVIIFADGSILVEPSTIRLEQHAQALGLTHES